ECGEACIDAVAVGLDWRALLRAECLECDLHARAHPVCTGLAIDVHRSIAEQLRQLACRAAAQQVHLEVAFLCVHVTERPCGVDAALRAYGCAAERIAFHLGRGMQLQACGHAIVPRHAALQHEPGRARDAGEAYEGDEAGACKQARKAASWHVVWSPKMQRRIVVETARAYAHVC